MQAHGTLSAVTASGVAPARRAQELNNRLIIVLHLDDALPRAADRLGFVCRLEADVLRFLEKRFRSGEGVFRETAMPDVFRAVPARCVGVLAIMVTLAAIPATMPAGSCPGTSGSLTFRRMPLMALKSVAQIPRDLMRTMACPGPAVGVGMSSNTNRLNSLSTAANTAYLSCAASSTVSSDSKAERRVGVLAISGRHPNYLLNKGCLSLTLALAIPAQFRFVRSIRCFAWDRNEAPDDHQ